MRNVIASLKSSWDMYQFLLHFSYISFFFHPPVLEFHVYFFFFKFYNIVKHLRFSYALVFKNEDLRTSLIGLSLI